MYLKTPDHREVSASGLLESSGGREVLVKSKALTLTGLREYSVRLVFRVPAELSESTFKLKGFPKILIRYWAGARDFRNPGGSGSSDELFSVARGSAPALGRANMRVPIPHSPATMGPGVVTDRRIRHGLPFRVVLQQMRA